MADFDGEYSDLVEDDSLVTTYPFYKGERFGVLTAMESTSTPAALPEIRQEPMLPRREP